MKNTIAFMLTVAGILIVFCLSAQNTAGTKESTTPKAGIENPSTPQGLGPNFTDKNGDGICDHRQGKGNRGRNFTDANKDGACDHLATRGNQRTGRNFVDANNDGVCDHLAERGRGRGCGNGYGYRFRNGQK